MFALAHLSDPHLAHWSRGPWRSLMNKRLSGYLSWALSRKKIHLTRVLDLIINDLRSMKPDHVVLTGDIVNISAEDEFREAAYWLHSWATDPQSLSIVPGNHDTYVELEQEKGIGTWAPYMTNIQKSPLIDPNHALAKAENDFPYVRILGEVAVVGISSAIPMPLFVAAGRIGQSQIQRVRKTLFSLRRLGLFRIVLIHHPPFPTPFLKRRKALLDAEALCAILGECGAELVLHGHTHMATLGRIGEIPVIGVPSASAKPKGYKDAAAYNIYRIGREGPTWHITTEIRGISADERQIESKGQFSFSIESPVHA